ncbi:hypothetical protein [Sinorhizobium saheli]|uniref:Uncharacterized protein n=1 Tax=Sinorhizobium saheli TaxID=36856 RepID=A0A178XGF6_SINSA|nr:hypothetical protein [Sinorhizobium saheli]MQW85661.1 hypothetical protein [Sinorhizobium saheli]OAP34330.1 hypothetical protein ATB98_23750 [Sinorhizobium saheli]
MTKHVTVSTDTETELASIARMLTYIRDSARALGAQTVEYCVEMALQAVADELRDRQELALADLERRNHVLQ